LGFLGFFVFFIFRPNPFFAVLISGLNGIITAPKPYGTIPLPAEVVQCQQKYRHAGQTDYAADYGQRTRERTSLPKTE